MWRTMVRWGTFTGCVLLAGVAHEWPIAADAADRTPMRPAGGDAVQVAVIGWRSDGTGQYPASKPVLEWSPEQHVRWKTALPERSHAGAVVSGDRVFVTSEPLELLCLHADDGRIVWQRSTSYSDAFSPERCAEIEEHHRQADELRRRRDQLRDEFNKLQKAEAGPEKTEPIQKQIEQLAEQMRPLLVIPPPRQPNLNGNATASPVTDGLRVFVLFGTGLVAAFTVEGERLWTKHVAVRESDFGHSASPVLVGDRLITQHGQLTAFDAATGEVAWELEGPCTFGSPVAARIGAVDVIITPRGEIVRVSDGRPLYHRLFDLHHTSPLVHEGIVYGVEGGTYRAYRLPETIEETDAPQRLQPLWQTQGFQQRTFASPLYHAGRLYIVSEQNVMDVISAETGKQVYRKRLDLGEGKVYPSPVAAGEYVITSSSNGTMLVLKGGDKYEEVARNTLEGFSGPPVFAGNRMYVRGYKHVYCIGE